MGWIVFNPISKNRTPRITRQRDSLNLTLWELGAYTEMMVVGLFVGGFGLLGRVGWWVGRQETH